MNFLSIIRPGYEDIALAELECELPMLKHRLVAPQLIESVTNLSEQIVVTNLTFVAQLLPVATPLAARSVNQWVELLWEKLSEHGESLSSKWNIVFESLPITDSKVGPRRLLLIEQGLQEILKKRRRRLLRDRDTESVYRFPLVQILFSGLEEGYLSTATEQEITRFPFAIVNRALGEIPMPEDKGPPSRAYLKLTEALYRFEWQIESGDSVVDLGSSPGSWSYVALQHGARVTAVDRSPLREDLMKNRALCFERGDGFTYSPDSRVDWLLCDIIAYPERTIELIQRWVGEGLCRRFCVTIKFKGEIEYGQLHGIKRWLSSRCKKFYVKQLNANKHEVMVVGEV